MGRYDVPAESALSDMRRGLLIHPVVMHRIRCLARLRIAARSSTPDARLYTRALLNAGRVLEPFIDTAELDYFARVWWSRRRHGMWGLAFPVGGRERYGRAGERVRSVPARTVTLAVEEIARRLEGKPPDAIERHMDDSNPRQALRKMRSLL
jgi:hypothetical protein